MPLIPNKMPPASVYLGDSLYAEFPRGIGAIKVWVQVGNNQSPPIYFQAETVAALMNYATKCYVTVTEDNDSEESDETEV